MVCLYAISVDVFFFFSSRRRHTRCSRDWSSDVCSSDLTSAIFPQVEFCREPDHVARDADALLILTEWPEFRQLDWKRVYDAMSRPLIVDGRNLLDPATMTELGFEYHGFVRPLAKPQPHPL